ncbi:MAG TPA: hypothetical protein VIJ34_14645 [Acidimicrobiales bacterium]
MHEREHLATRERAADATVEPKGAVHELLDPKARRQGRDEHEPSIGDECRLVEGHPNPVETARY